MNRPAQVKPDNFFLLLFNALRQRRVPLALRIASHSLLLVALALLIYTWVMGMQFKQAMQQQADAVGQSLIVQTAASATELLVSNDILSLNVLLSNLAKNPLVAHAAIYSVDNHILAEAGSRPTQSLLNENEGLYSTVINFQEVMAGQLSISLDMQQFQQPMTISLQSMGLLSLILLALALSLSLRLSRHISTPLLQLRLWLRDPDDPAPGAVRQDEIGDLARQLQARLVPEKPEPEVQLDKYEAFDPKPDFHTAQKLEPGFTIPELHDVDAEDAKPSQYRQPTAHPEADDPFADLRDLYQLHIEDQPASTAVPYVAESGPEPEPERLISSAVLAVQLGAQEQLRHLPRARLLELLERYRDCLEKAATLYQGKLFTLSNGSSLILFSSTNSGEDYLTHALCCGELLRALSHALQIEVADSGITLQLQLGLTRSNEEIIPNQAELLLSEAAQAALALTQHSRNLLLVQRTVADDPLLRQCARIRPIASPEGACCVERLLEPYPSLLERQLTRMHDHS